jgi:predicted DNA-binding transcriptional regulator YafY
MSKSKSPVAKYLHEGALNRLLLLIATLLKYPGVGYRHGAEHSAQDENHHNALTEVQTHLLAIAAQHNISLKCSINTIRKDISFLRTYGILGKQMYRWGYYLGTGVMDEQELTAALNALHSQAEYQKDTHIQELYNRLVRRLKGLDSKEQLFYPVRAHLNRAIVETDPVNIIASGSDRNLFDCLDVVETAIVKGQKIRLRRKKNPWQDKVETSFEVWPLQLLYHDIAWYLIHQTCENGHFAVSRIDRLEDQCTVTDPKGRSLDTQLRNLKLAHELLERGWGLFLGKPEEQRQELRGQLELVEVRVRFFPQVLGFIAESPLRHSSQRIELYPPGSLSQKTQYVDYIVQLPPRSLKEFSFWVYRFMGNAQVRSPNSLVEEHRQAAQQQADRYSNLD